MYLTDDADQAAARLDDATAWATAPKAGPELARLTKFLRRWRTEILAHHTTGASNGPVEAANLLLKQVKRSGLGFRNLDNYRLRILLAGGQPKTDTHPRHEHPTPTHQVARLGPIMDRIEDDRLVDVRSHRRHAKPDGPHQRIGY